MDRVRNIERHFLASGSIGLKSLSNTDRGLYSEWLAAVAWIEQSGDVLEHHRFRTKYSEVDLLFSSPVSWTWIEVKTLGSIYFLGTRLSAGQRKRISRGRFFLEETMGVSVRLMYAVVGHFGNVEFFDLI